MDKSNEYAELVKGLYDDLMLRIKKYNPEAIPMVDKAYKFAKEKHEGQNRRSGEPYIIHPLSVAIILSELSADQDTLCAGLLHDTLEDTNTTKEELEKEFNFDVAKLVNGVTNLSKMNIASRELREYANDRKIITSINDDVRIVIIKIADRLHNMRTLEYQSEDKQKEKSLETLKIYVPLAYNIGSYRIRNELEDICLSYLKPDEYKRISELRMKLEEESKTCLEEVDEKIKNNIRNVISDTRGIKKEDVYIKTLTKIKNVYGIYRKLKGGQKIETIHDLIIIKVLLENVNDCFLALNGIHKTYNPMPNLFKDYINNPKTNMYRSLHTTVCVDDGRLVQMQIRTPEIDKVDSFGITTYWNSKKGQAKYDMQEDIAKFQIFPSIDYYDKIFKDDKEFIKHIIKELFEDIIYVLTSSLVPKELPKGSTPIDFAYSINENLGNTMVEAKVNNIPVKLNYRLKNGDRVDIISNTASHPSKSWIRMCAKTETKVKILKYFDEHR